MDEFALIRRLTGGRTGKEGAVGRGVVVGIGDDAAVVEPTPGRQMVLTCDSMVEIVDFLPWTMDDASIGWKAMAQNVSDLAAMGAEPRYALCALAAPKGFPTERLEALYAGLYACADAYGVAIVGGDMSTSPERVSVTVTAIGEVEAGRALLRSGARAGDVVFATGPLGLSAAGLDWLLRREAGGGERWAPLVAAHRRPRPRPAAGRALLGLATSLNDVSDGLASEAREIAEASGVRLVLDGAAIPVDAALAAYAAFAGRDALEFILGGGEDYELVGTVPAAKAGELLAALRAAGAAPAIVGVVAAGEPGVDLARPDGTTEPLGRRGYTHFE
ncbi:thiamine-phosphate kinase [Paenibacillus sp.]|uniref:thiamine-phosphate kinase n=1 Tax=Paenibacillus sp. TaxID=58172 RepID=UPI002811EC4F|nr:thiamine-phosphate kinase [Paenibacillus sp.]